MAQLNWAFIGCGSIAKKVASQICPAGQKIISVYSRSFDKATQFAARYGACACESAEQAINIEEVDAVYIATPHTSHMAYAMQAMCAGKAVLCEKPVGISLSQAEQLEQCAKENGVYFAEAMWTWFCAPALKVKEWVQSGKIGQVQKIEIFHAFPGLMKPKTSRVLNPETAGGALLDIGIYPITYCYQLLGYPNAVYCKGKLKNGIDIGETIHLDYDACRCKLTTSFSVLKETCTIYGSEGEIEVPFFHMANKAVLKTAAGKQVFKAKTDYATEFARVAGEVQSGQTQSAYAPMSATKDCLKIMDECRRQMHLTYPFE